MNYLTRPGGKEISAQLPLPVDDVTQSSDRVAVAAETITFTCAAAQSGRGVVSTDKAPILNLNGDKVGSYWDKQANLVYTVSDTDLIGALVETAGSAEAVITDTANNLELMFETPTAASARYILKAIDDGGNVLYGWIKLVAASSNAYTFDIYDTAAMADQDWVGTLGSFDHTAIRRIEIYSNESSFVWGTGTVLTTEVEYNEEKDAQEFINGLADGEFAINYRAGTILYRKATAGTSDTCTYNTMAVATVAVSGGGAALDATHDSAVIATGPQVMAEAKNFDDSALPNSVAEGDAVRPAASLSGVQYVMAVNEDGSEQPAYDSGTDSFKGFEVNPISDHHVEETGTLATVLNATPQYLYYDMDGYKNATFQIAAVDAGGGDTHVITLEGTVQDDGTAAASCTYQDVTSALTGVANVAAVSMWIIDTPVAFKYLRIKDTTAGGNNDGGITVYAKRMY
jgi:hypothetical protein|tara:strand:- start:421 stop:1791 length:1371 start_codon:yes stop_codon:yes gene_type:complete